MNETIDSLLKKGGLLLAAGVLLTGCAWFGTDAPLQPLSYEAVEGERQPNLILFLRARGGSHKSFAEEGFVAAALERGFPFDMVAPNSHLGYYLPIVAPLPGPALIRPKQGLDCGAVVFAGGGDRDSGRDVDAAGDCVGFETV